MSDAVEPLDLDAERTAHDMTCRYCSPAGLCQTARLLAEVERLRAALTDAQDDLMVERAVVVNTASALRAARERLTTARRDALTEAADAASWLDDTTVMDWLRARAAQEEGR